MAAKFIVLLVGLVAAVRGGLIGVGPVVKAAPLLDQQYSFAYDVKDTLTGDFKSQIESQSGGVIRGQYSLIDPDGTKRVVDYTADPINGFNAVVSRTPIARVLPAPAVPVAPRFATPFVAGPPVPVVG